MQRQVEDFMLVTRILLGCRMFLDIVKSIEINLLMLKFIKVSSFQKFHFHPAIHRRPEKTDSFVGSAWSFVFFSPTTTANDLRLRKDFLSQILSITFDFFPILILQKEPVFPFSMLSAKQGNYWYHFYNVFGMTRSLTGDWTRNLPHSKPALYH